MKAGRKTSRSVGDARGITSSVNASSSILTIRVTVRRLLASPDVTVIPQTREIFLAGLTLYEARPDKAYSLTDCMSMHVLRREGLTDVLTNDRHFTQEGFHILFP
jgi:predicted nucleic acid-binding protein